jgi:hypothetical protein
MLAGYLNGTANDVSRESLSQWDVSLGDIYQGVARESIHRYREFRC